MIVWFASSGNNEQPPLETPPPRRVSNAGGVANANGNGTGGPVRHSSFSSNAIPIVSLDGESPAPILVNTPPHLQQQQRVLPAQSPYSPHMRPGSFRDSMVDAAGTRSRKICTFDEYSFQLFFLTFLFSLAAIAIVVVLCLCAALVFVLVEVISRLIFLVSYACRNSRATQPRGAPDRRLRRA